MRVLSRAWSLNLGSFWSRQLLTGIPFSASNFSFHCFRALSRDALPASLLLYRLSVSAFLPLATNFAFARLDALLYQSVFLIFLVIGLPLLFRTFVIFVLLI